MQVRKTWLDLDCRRRPNTDHHCYRCCKDIKPGAKYRVIHVVDGGWFALHPTDENRYAADSGDMGCHPVGLDCARQIGMEWTTAA